MHQTLIHFPALICLVSQEAAVYFFLRCIDSEWLCGTLDDKNQRNSLSVSAEGAVISQMAMRFIVGRYELVLQLNNHKLSKKQ